MTTTAIPYGWIEHVFSQGFAYIYSGKPNCLSGQLKGKRSAIISMSSSNPIIKNIYGSPWKVACHTDYISSILKCCGIVTRQEFKINFSMSDCKDNVLGNCLNEIDELLSTLFKERHNVSSDR